MPVSYTRSDVGFELFINDNAGTARYQSIRNVYLDVCGLGTISEPSERCIDHMYHHALHAIRSTETARCRYVTCRLRQRVCHSCPRSGVRGRVRTERTRVPARRCRASDQRTGARRAGVKERQNGTFVQGI
jgi:hypothetical protein